MITMLKNTMDKTDLTQSYKDNFSVNCKDESAFLGLLDALGMERKTETIKIKNLIFKPMPSAIEAHEIFAEEDDELLAAAFDSIENGTKVYVEVEGVPYMLRDTALASIYDRLQISGEALGKIPPETLAQHLNHYAAYAANEGLIVYNNGKIEAILGRKYSLVPTGELVNTAANYFADGMPAEFTGGSFTHSYTTATWKTGECMVEVPFDAEAESLLYEQSICLSTSDSGHRAITISPQMRQMGDRFGLEYCMPLKLEHDGNANVDTFEKMLLLIDKRFQDANQCIRNMLETTLEYPANVLLSMFKWLKIPAKYGAIVYESRKVMWGLNPKTAYDVYSALSEVLSLLMGEEQNAKELAQYRERFARALKFNFSDHDLPGQYGYNDKYIGKKGA